jgi:hypothetical protein
MNYFKIITSILIAFILYLASLGQTFGWEYYWSGFVLFILLITFINYKKFSKSWLYWILPFILSLGIMMLFIFIGWQIFKFKYGDIILKIIFISICTVLIQFCYALQECFFDGKKIFIYKDYSRFLHYLASIFVFATGYGVNFYLIEPEGDRLIVNRVLYWVCLMLTFVIVYALNFSFFKLTLPNIHPKKQTIIIHSSIIAFIIFELFYLLTLLSFRYIQSGVLIFLIFFSIMEITRHQIDKTISRFLVFINVGSAAIGVIIILVTSKWGY